MIERGRPIMSVCFISSTFRLVLALVQDELPKPTQTTWMSLLFSLLCLFVTLASRYLFGAEMIQSGAGCARRPSVRHPSLFLPYKLISFFCWFVRDDGGANRSSNSS